MNEGYKIRDQSLPHFLTFTVVDWIDVFKEEKYCNIFLDSVKYCQANKGMILMGFVFMTNHFHCIMQSSNNKLSDLIRDFKKFTSKRIIKAMQEYPITKNIWMLDQFANAASLHSRNSKYQFWKYGSHPEEIYSEKFLWTKLDYIHLNPVKVGYVKKASRYPYSSASNYVTGKGLIDVELADNPVIDVLHPDSFWKSITW